MSDQGWRPIDSAPKDGTPILAYHPFAFADGTPDAVCDVTAWDVRGGFWFNRTASNYYQRCAENAQPTHWQPLPPPPPTTGDNPVPISNIKDKTDGNC